MLSETLNEASQNGDNYSNSNNRVASRPSNYAGNNISISKPFMPGAVISACNIIKVSFFK
ncbi:hypothetical protein C6Y40_02895 [Alteromonas alba]|uniref:Uncharacterized protein n=1 Tax=Alteromonas alba TaxID=2079529 RepID=A0A2S9VFD0_9ALTE|nr:hypothetical protein C6Y40_02895 [Alteromonas alba]HAU93883.1 hypothetical protein [Alteromonas sp.]